MAPALALLLAAAVFCAAAADDCHPVRQFFATRNVTAESQGGDGGAKGTICGGKCCNAETEASLKAQGRRDLATLLRHNSKALHGTFHTTSHTLHKHVSELAYQSENKTKDLFSTVYKRMAILARQPIEAFYGDIRSYIEIESTDTKTNINSDKIEHSTVKFFTDIFPLALHYSLGIQNKDFTLKHKQCLKDNIDDISPFGEIPKLVARDLAKSLEATRLLLQAFNIGMEVLNTTDTLLIGEQDSEQCHDALLKMIYCPKCQGLTKNTKPCAGYCLNVLRGCVARYVAELDKPWNGYVEGIESLVNAIKRSNNDAGVNADLVIRDLSNRISSAIMHFMEKIKDVAAKAHQTCGAPEYSPQEEMAASPASLAMAPTATTKRSFAPLPEMQLTHFLTSVDQSKGFYSTLADTLCKDATFAEQRDDNCWNGERVSGYGRTVVGVGLNAQKYNPEVKTSVDLQNVDPRIERLVDKLRHVHHMAQSSLGPNFSNSDYHDMQQDGVDGSGSGHGPDSEDDDDEYNSRASGSGNGAIDNGDDETRGGDDRSKVTGHSPDQSAPRNNIPTVIVTSRSGALLPAVLPVAALSALTLRLFVF